MGPLELADFIGLDECLDIMKVLYESFRPEWIHTRENGVTTNSIAGEVALDFMFWPAAKHRFGWYVEPAYDYDFGRGHEQSVGVTGGLLIAIP